MPQAQFVPTKVRWLQDAFMETRKWPFWKNGDGGYHTICPACGDDFSFSEKDGYAFKIGEPALTVDPDILCPKPSCDGAIHVYYRDVVLLRKKKGETQVVAATATTTSDNRQSIVDKVREKMARVRQVP